MRTELASVPESTRLELQARSNSACTLPLAGVKTSVLSVSHISDSRATYPDLLKTALGRSFVMLRPDIQWKNPVMFTVEVGTIVSVLYTVAKAVQPAAYAPTLPYLIALDLWLFLTVLFANFAEAL